MFVVGVVVYDRMLVMFFVFVYVFDGKVFVCIFIILFGVYCYFDVDDELLYVGKVGNFKKCVGSYFLKLWMELCIVVMVL